MGLGVLPRTLSPSPADASQKPAGMPSVDLRAAPILGNQRSPALPSTSTAAAAKAPPRTKVSIGETSSDYVDDGADVRGGAGHAVGKDALLSEDPTQFWESEDESPFVNVVFSQLDVLTELAIRFDPGDESEDMLPEQVEVLTGVSVRKAKAVARLTIDQASKELQPLLGENALLPPSMENQPEQWLTTDVFVVVLRFLGLREESEGHIRVRQVYIKSEGMKARPRPALPTDESGQELDPAGWMNRQWPCPSPDHAAVLRPWAEPGAVRTSRSRSRSRSGVLADALATPDRAADATRAEGVHGAKPATPLRHWRADGPKYQLDEGEARGPTDGEQVHGPPSTPANSTSRQAAMVGMFSDWERYYFSPWHPVHTAAGGGQSAGRRSATKTAHGSLSPSPHSGVFQRSGGGRQSTPMRGPSRSASVSRGSLSLSPSPSRSQLSSSPGGSHGRSGSRGSEHAAARPGAGGRRSSTLLPGAAAAAPGTFKPISSLTQASPPIGSGAGAERSWSEGAAAIRNASSFPRAVVDAELRGLAEAGGAGAAWRLSQRYLAKHGISPLAQSCLVQKMLPALP
jgi:hypothetical protein